MIGLFCAAPRTVGKEPPGAPYYARGPDGETQIIHLTTDEIERYQTERSPVLVQRSPGLASDGRHQLAHGRYFAPVTYEILGPRSR